MPFSRIEEAQSTKHDSLKETAHSPQSSLGILPSQLHVRSPHVWDITTHFGLQNHHEGLLFRGSKMTCPPPDGWEVFLKKGAIPSEASYILSFNLFHHPST